jgi:5S rRNA maturation endonuclease (ribonuclease M5)
MKGVIRIINEINIREELEEFEWTRANWSNPNYLMAASPFRYDSHPSFYVYLTDTPTAKAGSWGDRGSIDPEYERGGFVKLLAFLRDESYEETLEYLSEKYGFESAANGHEIPKLNVPTLSQRLRNRQSLDESVLSPFRFRHPYLLNRGVDEKVQRLMGVGYSKSSGAVTLPWRLADGKLANVKFRKTAGKAFWYAKGGVAIRDLIYGIDVLYRRKPTIALITEAEIDALTGMSCGYASVATGGSAFNRTKADLLIRAPVDEYVISTDNDATGRKLRVEIEKALRGYKRLSYVDFSEAKDVNELRVKYGVEAVRSVVERRITVPSTQINVLSGGRRRN